MPKIVCVNEKRKVYNTPEDLEKFVHYVYNPLKTRRTQSGHAMRSGTIHAVICLLVQSI